MNDRETRQRLSSQLVDHLERLLREHSVTEILETLARALDRRADALSARDDRSARTKRFHHAARIVRYAAARIRHDQPRSRS